VSLNDLVTCAFGKAAEQAEMVRRWIDRAEPLWAGPALDGVNVHIHAVTRDGLNAGVNVSPDEAAVLADYAAARGHKNAISLARARQQVAST
jgi:hypothetical protein